MVDVHSISVRSKNMQAIKAQGTKPEMIVRRMLHRMGFRYRLHVRSLPGTPDIVLPKYNAIVQVQGCFWHGHNCHYFKLPETRREFWNGKINDNQCRDQKNYRALLEQEWRVALIWECALKGKAKNDFSERLSAWIRNGNSITLTISGS